MKKKQKQKTLKIIIAYTILGLVWSVISNSALRSFSNDMGTMLKLDLYREYFYIVFSASFLYFIINNMEIRYTDNIKNLKAKNAAIRQELDSLNMKLHSDEYANKKLERYANTDELTGLYNRRKGMDLIKEQMNLAADNGDTMLIAFVDIDNIKMVNDNFGHIEGDVLLTSVAVIIKDTLARTDIVCRYGGDEFLIGLPGASEKDVQGIRTRLEAAVSNYNTYSFKNYAISLSIGFSEFDGKHSRRVEDLIQIADDKMYVDKRSKKLLYVGNFR